MNQNPPIDQNTIEIYKGNEAELRAKYRLYGNARVTSRKWQIPPYVRKTGFPGYESQMKLLFLDAEIDEVILGKAIRTVPADGEDAKETIKRDIFDECNYQGYSMIFRSFTDDNHGTIDASGAPEQDGQKLWDILVKFNYGINDDSIPFLKQNFYNPLKFRQLKDMTLDMWAKEVRSASQILVSNGHPISEKEKTLTFRQGLIREDLQTGLILPARTETFEQLVQTARSWQQSADSTITNLSSKTSTSQRIFMSDDTSCCSCCLKETGSIAKD